MKSETRLDLAVFQLTPTRTRCDLVIMANGKTEKIASGLLNPFLSHLKTAQDQIEIGGYSIKLEPDPVAEAAWFTKGTVERFVRFVSTPEVLERVNTIESEIVQIGKAISVQGSDNLSLSSVEDHRQMKSIGNIEGNKPTFDADAEKAIILYKPGSHVNPPESNASKMHEENSKVQLLRVLESRKKVLQKEQAMAFARTAAAGFDIESVTHLISFAESFGASRLMEACTRYIQLWKGKHETGQWIEVEAAEALSYRSEFSPLNSSGIILSGDAMRQKDLAEMWPVSGIDTSIESNGNITTQDNDRDKRFSPEPQAPRGPHEFYQGQFQHPAFPPWPMLSQPGPHGFQPYPMQAMPYYQNYPMNGQFFHPPPTAMEDPRLKVPKRKTKKKHSMNSRDSTSISEGSSEESTLESEGESSKGHSSHQKAAHSKQKKGVVVIRNLNYIAGNRHETHGNGSESSHDSEIEGNKDSLIDNRERKQKSLKPSKGRDNNYTKSLDISNVHGKDDEIYSQEADAGNWQAFQSFLLRAEEKMTSVVDEEILAGEKEPRLKKGQNKSGPDHIVLPERDCSGYREEGIMEYNAISGKGRLSKQFVSADEILVAGRCMQDKQIATHFKEIEGVGGFKKAVSDASIMYRQEKQVGINVSSDPLLYCEHGHDGTSEKSSLHGVNDESFMVPVRAGSQDPLGVDRRLNIDIDSEFPSVSQRNEDSSNKETTKVTYEPDDLTLMLGRTRESESIGYGPAIDYDIQASLAVKHEYEKEGDDIPASSNKGSVKTVEARKLKLSQGGLEKKQKDVKTTKMTSSRSTPSIDAHKRAEKLRNYKADLQKLKKEQEEEEKKRLEALKRERQKRIATRSGSNPVQSPSTPQHHKPRLPAKVASSANKSSKFTDSEPGSNSPLQRLRRNISSTGCNGFEKAPKTVRSNRFGLSASSLPEFKKEGIKQEGGSTSEQIRRLSEPKGKVSVRQEGSSSSERIRRLSEPKGIIARNVPDKLSKNNIHVMKRPSSEEPQSKKISAIIQLDRTKSETLPELKINTYKPPSEPIKDKHTSNQQKEVGSTSSLISEKKVEKMPSFNCSDENPEVEKTVVVLENEVVTIPPVQATEWKADSVDKSYRDVRRNMTGVDTVYTAIRAPPSPLYGVEVKSPTEGDRDGQIYSYEDESERLLDQTAPEKPYRAPYARISSLEEPATGLHSVDQLDETQEKARNKESKGLKKLWKFGRKGYNSGLGDGNSDSNGSIVDDHMITSSSSDTSTLKNLISQAESNTVATQPKVSGPFSILSPFRGRNKEKKVAA